MAADGGSVGRTPGSRGGKSSFHWVSSSPSPAEVASLEARYPDVVHVPVAELEAEATDWHQRALLMRTFHRWVPAEAFLREFRRAGVPGEIVPLSLAHRSHIFRFADSSARDMVLNRPWLVNGQPVAAEIWKPEFFPAADAVTAALLWIRLPNLPIEFWREAILSEIVAPIGRFIYADAATMARNRGAYARVCVHVELRSPLRPGSRLRGLSGTFWQQYVYENLDGICQHCGSLHLCGDCSSPVRTDAQASSEAPLFGAWMAAIRQRSYVQGSKLEPRGKGMMNSGLVVPDLRSKGSSQNPDLADMAEGWSTPAKTARRWGVRGQKVSSVVSEDLGKPHGKNLKEDLEIGTVPGLTGRAGFSKGGPSLVSAVSDIQQKEVMDSQSLQSNNPFAALDGEPTVDGPLGSRDACPSPLKRARPVEYLAPRTVTKKGIKKGKGSTFSSKIKQVKADGSDHLIDVLGSSSVNPNKRLVGEKVQSVSTIGPSSDSDNLDQELGLTAIDQAPRSKEVDDSMICIPQSPEDFIHSGCLPDSAMAEDLGGARFIFLLNEDSSLEC